MLNHLKKMLSSSEEDVSLHREDVKSSSRIVIGSFKIILLYKKLIFLLLLVTFIYLKSTFLKMEKSFLENLIGSVPKCTEADDTSCGNKICLIEVKAKFTYGANVSSVKEYTAERFFVSDFKKFLGDDIGYPGNNVNYKVVEINELYITGRLKDIADGSSIIFFRRQTGLGDECHPFNEKYPFMFIECQEAKKLALCEDGYIIHSVIEAGENYYESLFNEVPGEYKELETRALSYAGDEVSYYNYEQDDKLLRDSSISGRYLSVSKYIDVSKIKKGQQRTREKIKDNIASSPKFILSSLKINSFLTLRFLHEVVTDDTKEDTQNKIINSIIKLSGRKDQFIIRGTVFAYVEYDCQVAKEYVTRYVSANKELIKNLIIIFDSLNCACVDIPDILPKDTKKHTIEHLNASIVLRHYLKVLDKVLFTSTELSDCQKRIDINRKSQDEINNTDVEREINNIKLEAINEAKRLSVISFDETDDITKSSIELIDKEISSGNRDMAKNIKEVESDAEKRFLSNISAVRTFIKNSTKQLSIKLRSLDILNYNKNMSEFHDHLEFLFNLEAKTKESLEEVKNRYADKQKTSSRCEETSSRCEETSSSIESLSIGV